jgi:opacity protein-like surface antigen
VWTGIYIGTNIGGAWSDPNWSFPFVESFNTAAGQNFTASSSGLLWGGQLGLNYQFHEHFLFGVEATYAGSRMSGMVTGAFPLGPTDQFNIDAADLFTVSGRLGVIAGQYLFYAKGGYASSLVEINAGNALGTTAHASQRLSGWLVGAGLESRVVSNIIFGVEYNYIDLSGDRFTGVTAGTVPGAPFNVDISDLHTHTVTARLSILFGPHACCSEGVLGKW